jgi:hypothetical protein
LVDRYLVSHKFKSGRTAKWLFQWVAEWYLSDDGVGYRCIPAEGTYLSPVDWANIMVGGVFDQIKKIASWVWYIDPYKELRAHTRGYKPAPFMIYNADSPRHYRSGTLKVSQDSNGYANSLRARLRTNDGTDWQTVVVSASDPVEIAARAAVEGGNGLHQLHVDLTEAVTPEQGIDQIQGKLDECGSFGDVITYVTRTAGLRAGMVQHIECTDLDIDGNYMITAVRMKFESKIISFQVTASSWKSNKDFTQFMADALAAKTNWRTDELVVGEAWPVQKTDGVKVGDDVKTKEAGTGPCRLGISQLGWTEMG